MSFHIAQVNVARGKAPLDDPLMADFVAALDPVNAAADEAPGFVWRLQTDEGDATGIQAYDDPSILFNLSVWESIQALSTYVYGGLHLEPFRDRRRWFVEYDGPQLALWWIPEGHVPSVEEAVERLAHIGEHGPTAKAFTFGQRYPMPDRPDSGQWTRMRDGDGRR